MKLESMESSLVFPSEPDVESLYMPSFGNNRRSFKNMRVTADVEGLEGNVYRPSKFLSRIICGLPTSVSLPDACLAFLSFLSAYSTETSPLNAPGERIVCCAGHVLSTGPLDLNA